MSLSPSKQSDLPGRAYNVSGREGVRLEFNNGKHLLIGSQRCDELAAIESLMNQQL